jgi:hypothetical protein
VADDPGDGEELPDGSYMSLDDILQGEINKYLSADELSFLQFLQTRIATDKGDATVLKLPVYLRSENEETGEVQDTDIMTLIGGGAPTVKAFNVYPNSILTVGTPLSDGDYVMFALNTENATLIEPGSGELYISGIDDPVAVGLDVMYEYVQVPTASISAVVDIEPKTVADVAFYLKYKDLRGSSYTSEEAIVSWRFPVFVLTDDNDGDVPSDESLSDGTYTNQDGSPFDADYLLENAVQNLSVSGVFNVPIKADTRRVAYALPDNTPRYTLELYNIGVDCAQMMAKATMTMALNDNLPAAAYRVYVYQGLDTLEPGIWRLYVGI